MCVCVCVCVKVTYRLVGGGKGRGGGGGGVECKGHIQAQLLNGGYIDLQSLSTMRTLTKLLTSVISCGGSLS